MKAVDLRSDTVTQPTEKMRHAMMAAPLGDDVFGDDPTVLELQHKVAGLLDKEAALYVPTGTMANQLALRAHTQPGDEIIAHRGCHIYNYESGAAAALAGLTVRTLDSGDGQLPIKTLVSEIHQTDDPLFANTRLICMENTHNARGGRVLDPKHVLDVATIAKSRGIPMHLDGARLMNAMVASKVSAAQLAAPFATVSICLSKGLGAPMGSVLAGTSQLIQRAYRFRKMYGGGMRQAGVVAAAGIYALDHHVEGLSEDHRRARKLAEAIADVPGLSVDLAGVQTNLVYFQLIEGHPLDRLNERGENAFVAALADHGVLITGGHGRYRAVTHRDVDDEGLDRAIQAFKRLETPDSAS